MKASNAGLNAAGGFTFPCAVLPDQLTALRAMLADQERAAPGLQVLLLTLSLLLKHLLKVEEGAAE